MHHKYWYAEDTVAYLLHVVDETKQFCKFQVEQVYYCITSVVSFYVNDNAALLHHKW